MELKIDFEDSKKEIMKIGHGIKEEVMNKYWLLDKTGKIKGSSICWLFCWGETKGKGEAKDIFNKIFGDNSFESFETNIGYGFAKLKRYRISDDNIKKEI